MLDPFAAARPLAALFARKLRRLRPGKGPSGALIGDVDPASLVPVLDLYVRIGRVAFGRSLRGVTLAATDVTWQTGSGPVIEGPALELLLLLAGRRAPLRDMRGPGLGRVGGEPAAGPVVDPPA